MNKKKLFLFLSMLATMLFLLSSCDSAGMTGDVWSGVGESFSWFFQAFTPSYFGIVVECWDVLALVGACWEIPTIIGGIVALLMTAFVVLVSVVVSLVLFLLYIILLILFVGVFLLIVVVALLLVIFGVVFALLFIPFA